jgi:hypothetical protein
VDSKAMYLFPLRFSNAKCCSIEVRKEALTWQPSQQIITKSRYRYKNSSSTTAATEFPILSAQQLNNNNNTVNLKNGNTKGRHVYRYTINNLDSSQDGSDNEEEEGDHKRKTILLSTFISPLIFNQIESAFSTKIEERKPSSPERAINMEIESPESGLRDTLPALECGAENKVEGSKPVTTPLVDDEDDIFADVGVNYATEVKKDLLIKPVVNSTATISESSIFPESLLAKDKKSSTSIVQDDESLSLLTKRAMQSMELQYGEEDDGMNGHAQMDYYLDEEDGDIISTRILQSSHNSGFDDGKAGKAAKRQELNKRKVKETNKWNQVNRLLEKDQYQKMDKLEQQLSEKRFKSTGNYLGIR